MKQVFAPWRIEWVERDDQRHDIEQCVFCTLCEQTKDRENLLVARSEHAFVLLNNYPYNPGHAMVIPYHHTGNFAELDAEELLDHALLIQRTLRALTSTFSPQGYNTGLNLGKFAGGSITDHLHTHVVPRWQGDTNFMAVISDTKVIVESLEDTYDRLHGAFIQQEGVECTESDQAALVQS